MIRRPPRSTLFPTRRSSDLHKIARTRDDRPVLRFDPIEDFEKFAGIMLETNRMGRSEEHTSELQSQSNLVCRLLLEKKKINRKDRVGRADVPSVRHALSPAP